MKVAIIKYNAGNIYSVGLCAEAFGRGGCGNGEIKMNCCGGQSDLSRCGRGGNNHEVSACQWHGCIDKGT